MTQRGEWIAGNGSCPRCGGSGAPGARVEEKARSSSGKAQS